MTNDQISLADLQKLADRASRDADKLGKAVALLAARIVPYEDERQFLEQVRYRPSFPSKKATSLKDIENQLASTNEMFDAMLRDFAALRAMVDQMANDSWSRDDMKRYMKRK